MSPRLVVFDLDGTLVDSSQDLAAAINATLERLSPGTPPLVPERVRGFIGSGARVLVRRSLEAAGIATPLETALPVFVEAYSARLLDTTLLYPGILEALDRLAGRRLAVLTNKPGDMSRRILEGLGVAGRFARVLGGGDLASKKPDPEGLRLLLAEAGTPPESAVLVGDSAIDVETGRAAGVGTAGVTWGFDPQGVRAAGPDLLLDAPAELAARLVGVGPTVLG